MPILFGVQASTLISITVCMIKNDRITALDPARNLAGLIIGRCDYFRNTIPRKAAYFG